MTSPVQVNMTPQEAENLKKNIVVEMVVQPQGSLDVNVKMEDKEIQKHFEGVIFKRRRNTSTRKR